VRQWTEGDLRGVNPLMEPLQRFGDQPAKLLPDGQPIPSMPQMLPRPSYRIK
jgi:hypothetical protein